MRVNGTLAFLAGGWRISRTLTDHRSAVTGRFTGTAAFTGRPERPQQELGYLEEGDLRFGDHAGPAARSLTWLGLPGGGADVRFADGRPFCVVDLRPGSCETGHPCNRDYYRISYRVLGPDQFEERWQVRGPAKDYDATAVLTRLPRARAGW